MIRREKKKTFTYSARPSVKKLALQKAEENGKTLSQIIEELLIGFSGWQPVYRNPMAKAARKTKP